MKVIPLSAVASQAFESQVTADTLAKISLRTFGGALYFTLDGVVMNRICRDRQRLLIDAQYREFGGDFMFIDTQGFSDPVFTGLGSRYLLVYLNDNE